MKRLAFIPLLLAPALFGAAPDWPQLEKEAVETLQRYVRIQSVNPPADTREAAAFLKSVLDRNGISARLLTSGPNGQTNLLARLPGRDRTKKPLLLLNHLDVVPVDRKAWQVDPFAGLTRDGFLWGRGSLDMKSLGVQQLMTLMALRQAGVTPGRDIVMLSTADEETGGAYGIVWMIANHFQEIDAEWVLDEGGMGTTETLAAGKLVFGVAVGEKQTLWLRLRAAGTAAHGSQPIADNANLTLLDAVRKAMALAPVKPNPIVAEMVRRIGAPLADNRFTRAIRGNTVSLTTLQSGVGSPVKVNVIPSTAEATLDCRILPGVNVQEFVSEMKARIDNARVSVEVLSHPVDPGISSPNTPLFQAIRNVLVKRHPGAAVTPMLVPFGTDSVNLRAKGITAYGFSPMVLDPQTASSAHGDAERVPLGEFLMGLRIYYDVLSAL